VTELEMQKATKITKYFMKHAEVAFDMASKTKSTNKEKNIYEWCVKNQRKINEMKVAENLGNVFTVKPRDPVSNDVAGAGASPALVLLP